MHPSEVLAKAARGAPFGALGVLGSFLIPETGGGVHTGPRTSAAGLNRPRWAKIVDAAGTRPVRYAWEEHTFQVLAPGEDTSIGFVRADAGIVGTVNLNPIIEPNRRALAIGDFCLVQQEYYDPTYDWIFSVLGSTGASGGISYAKALTNTSSGGRFDARLQGVNPDGTLTDPISGGSVWLRDGNNRTYLVQDQIYMCALTGSTLGRPVYTTIDTGLSIYDMHTAQWFQGVWELQIDSTPTTYNPALGDFAYVWDAATRTLTMRLNGQTGNFDFVTRCDSGDLYKRNIAWSNGLTKTVEDPDVPLS